MKTTHYYPTEVSPGKWRVGIAFPGKVALVDLDTGELPKGGFTPWPSFESKEQADAFIEGLLAASPEPK